MSFIRLIHLLAHHPDFSNEDQDLKSFAQFIEFYLSCIATAENISYLYHASQRIKTSVDNVSEEKSVVSDIHYLSIEKNISLISSLPLIIELTHISGYCMLIDIEESQTL